MYNAGQVVVASQSEPELQDTLLFCLFCGSTVLQSNVGVYNLQITFHFSGGAHSAVTHIWAMS